MGRTVAGVGTSTLGHVAVAVGPAGLRAVALADDATSAVAEVASRVGGATRDDDAVAGVLAEVLAVVDGRSADVDVPLDPGGTPYQRRVWEALRGIPAGTTTTYGALAATLGGGTVARAVAGACGANPLAVVVPCHRVLGADGSLTGFRWGLDRKRALLRREGVVA